MSALNSAQPLSAACSTYSAEHAYGEPCQAAGCLPPTAAPLAQAAYSAPAKLGAYDMLCMWAAEAEEGTAGADLRGGPAQVLQARLVHGSSQDDIAVVAHHVGHRVVQLEGLRRRVLILNGPFADSSAGLLEALRQATAAGEDVHCAQRQAIILCMGPVSTRA